MGLSIHNATLRSRWKKRSSKSFSITILKTLCIQKEAEVLKSFDKNHKTVQIPFLKTKTTGCRHKKSIQGGTIKEKKSLNPTVKNSSERSSFDQLEFWCLFSPARRFSAHIGELHFKNQVMRTKSNITLPDETKIN